MLLTLAKSTGWPEPYLLWKLPLARALAYYHAALRSEGCWTVRREAAKPVGKVIPTGFFDSGEDDDEWDAF